jgi:hypothetical protein
VRFFASASALGILSRLLRVSSHSAGRAGAVWLQFKHRNATHPKENIMNIAKNMEALFVAAAVLVSAASFATAAAPKVLAAPAAPTLAAAGQAPMLTVVVVGKRLSAAEKAAM